MKKIQDLKQKMTAFGLVAVLAASGLFGFAEAAPRPRARAFSVGNKAPETQKVELSFDTTDDTNASIIRGDTITVNASNTKNCVGQTPPIYINSQSGSNPGVKNDLFDITSQDKSIIKIRPRSQKELDEQGDGKKAAEETYELRSNFGDMAWKADQAFLKDSNINGEFVLLDESGKNGFNILAKSELVLKYSGDPQSGFSIVGTPTGAFNTFQDRVNVIKYYPGNENGSDPERWLLEFYEKGGVSRQVEFTPKYRKEVKVEDGEEGETRIECHLPKDKEYTITYNYNHSYTLTLTVKDPQKVLQERANACVSTDLKRNEFIDPHEEEDDVLFITDNIDLVNKTEAYGQEIRLSWAWESEEDKDVVVISQGKSGRSLAEVSRREKDVKGRLVVTASFVTDELNDDVPNRSVSSGIDIVIHGKGTPADIKTINGYVGAPAGAYEEEQIKTEKDPMPQKIYMDVYNNRVEGYKMTDNYHHVTFDIDMGKDNGRAKQMIVELLDKKGNQYTGGGVSATITGEKDTVKDYKFNSTYDNSKNGGTARVTFTVTAEKEIPENLQMRFRFFVDGAKGGSYREEKLAQCETVLNVTDTSPDSKAEFSKIRVTSNGKDLKGFSFSPETVEYEIEVPYHISGNEEEKLVLNIAPETWKTCSRIVGVTVYSQDEGGLMQEATAANGWPGKDGMEKKWKENVTQEGEGSYSLDAGNVSSRSFDIELAPGQKVQAVLKVRAQNPQYVQTYTLDFYRAMPSNDSTLRALHIYDEGLDGKKPADHMEKLQDGVWEYTIKVPYGAEYLQVVPEPEDAHAALKSSEPELTKREGKSADKPEWYDIREVTPENPGTLKLTMLAEDQVTTSTYTITVEKEAPDNEAHLASLTVTDMDNKAVSYTPPFHTGMAEGDYYEIHVPYHTDTVKIAAVPKSLHATMLLKYNALNPLPDGSEKADAPVTVEMNATNSFKVPLPILRDQDKYFVTTVEVTAEDGATKVTYPLHIYREAPSKENALDNLVLQDAITGTDISTYPDAFFFEKEKTDYVVSVPYEVEKVMLTPTAAYPFVRKITVGGANGSYTVKDKQQSPAFSLNYPADTALKVTVYPEDPDENVALPKTYTVTFMRRDPSGDARLKKMTLENGEKLEPMFLPETLEYKAQVKLGAPGIIVHALPNHPYATMKINGLPVKQGDPSPLIEFMKANEDIKIEVTAQDNKTVCTYVIHMTDQNKIEHSNNADLAKLVVDDGVMTPEFQPSVTDYDVAVTEETWSVQLFAMPADPLAEVKVYNGSKEIGDQNKNYAAAIEDGENEFRVEVTSPDKTKTQEYNVSVFRNEEDKMNTLKPVTVDDVNYDLSDPIVVDISKYGRVSAEVLIKLRDEYPEKSIVFEGNDYSLRMKGSELSKNIPETLVYDFRMKFTCDEIPTLQNMIGAYPQNGDMRVVHVHFAHHGDLPAPTILNLSLGAAYGNQPLYWHYYNKERDRIDFYGVANSNARGTIALRMTHMSHYIITSGHSIVGAEDRSGQISLAPTSNGGKLNPNTGVRR